MTINRRKRLTYFGLCNTEKKIISDSFIIYNKERASLNLEKEELSNVVINLFNEAWKGCKKGDKFELNLNYVELRHMMKIIKSAILYKFREGQIDNFDGEGTTDKEIFDRIKELKESLEKN